MNSKTKEAKNKKILLISQNFSPEPTGIGKYNGEMMDWFASNGYDCTVVTTYPYYPQWQVQAPYKRRAFWYKKEVINYASTNTSLVIHRCPLYVPKDPSGKKRIIQDMSFWLSMIWKVLQLAITAKSYDLIITVAPPFHLGYLGLMLKKRTGGKLLYHIQDLQIDAAQELNMIKNEKFLEMIYKSERKMLEKADFVSTISTGMARKIQGKVNRDIFIFPNWVDSHYIFPIESSYTLKTNWGYKSDDVIFLYSGAIGEKQALDDILYAAESHIENKKIQFIICGSGPYKTKLMLKATELKLTNVKFLPVQDRSLFNEFLNMADYHFILQKAQTSELVMPSKFATILGIGGVCIAATSPGTTLHNIIDSHNLGYIIEPEKPHLLSKLIGELQPDGLAKIKKANALRYARKHLNINNVMNDFLNNIGLTGQTEDEYIPETLSAVPLNNLEYDYVINNELC